MDIAFRVDASIRIGTGHVIRCLTLGRRLKAEGARIRFVGRHMPEYLRRILESEGFEVKLARGSSGEFVGDLPHSAWLGTSQRNDADDTRRLLADRNWDWLIVDHYALDARWETLVRDCTDCILAIDDIADRTHDCDALLDQNLHSDMLGRYLGKVPAHCALMLGPRFALLREEFARLRSTIGPRQGAISRILVFMGGFDEHNCTSRVLDAIDSLDSQVRLIDVVIGAQHPDRDAIEARCRARNMQCHVQTTRMAELMTTADLAIGASGSATWERCCLGVPTITLALAENQISIAQAVGQQGACQYLGRLEDVDSTMLSATISSALRNPEVIRVMSKKAFDLVDGLGVDRICRYLI